MAPKSAMQQQQKARAQARGRVRTPSPAFGKGTGKGEEWWTPAPAAPSRVAASVGARDGGGSGSAEKAAGPISAPTTPPALLAPSSLPVAASVGAAWTGAAAEPAAEDHRLRTCRECGAKDHWRKMKESFMEALEGDAPKRKDTVAERADVLDGKQKQWYEHTCETCWALHLGVTVEEARRDIKGVRHEKGLARAKAYKEARGNVQQEFEFLGTDTVDPEQPMGKRKLLRAIRRKVNMKIATLADLFVPILSILKAKAEDENAALAAAGKFTDWLNALPLPGSAAIDEERGARLEADFAAASYKTRAFADRGDDAAAFYRAADYTDEWFNEGGKAFRTYYVCLAGGTVYTCGHAIASDVWDRLHNDAVATGQRWYCPVCNARYRAGWGVLCEIVHPERSLYCLADVPPHSLADAKRMAVERCFAKARTPQELLEMLPRAKPFDNGVFLKPLATRDGVYKFDVPLFRSIERFPWMQLYNLSGVVDTAAPGSSPGPSKSEPVTADGLLLEEC